MWSGATECVWITLRRSQREHVGVEAPEAMVENVTHDSTEQVLPVSHIFIQDMLYSTPTKVLPAVENVGLHGRIQAGSLLST